jgi:2,3-bisphosphoglycerate-independent phosphoglycerate mutase
MTFAEAIRAAYREGQEDEALLPIVKFDENGRAEGRIGYGDALIFYDIRGEREIEITRSLVDADFTHFRRTRGLDLDYVTLIEYDSALRVKVAFPPEARLRNTLVEVVSRAGLHLAKIAESEKSPHIGFFLNGRNDEVFAGEERFIVPSPRGITYDRTPEMSADLVAAEVDIRLRDPSFRLLIANVANCDVVGHIENREAVLRAVEAADRALGKIVESCRECRATLLVTADHGTVEEWTYPDGTINTGHTRNPVPFIICDFGTEDAGVWGLRDGGELGDIAPTLLDLLEIRKPSEMTGQTLLSPSAPIPKLRTKNRRIVLLILDGWGIRPECEGNMITAASTPHFDGILASYPGTLLAASGEAVGMPVGTVGNSEAGHLHIGAGRRVLLDRVKIDRAIEDGSFFRNAVLMEVMDAARRKGKALHLMGIISHYSSHGTLRHLFALLRQAKERGLEKVFIHGFIGRRGERPESGAIYVEKVEETARSLGIGEVVTVMGRHWSLDREGNWDRIEKAYRALVEGKGTGIC